MGTFTLLWLVYPFQLQWKKWFPKSSMQTQEFNKSQLWLDHNSDYMKRWDCCETCPQIPNISNFFTLISSVYEICGLVGGSCAVSLVVAFGFLLPKCGDGEGHKALCHFMNTGFEWWALFWVVGTVFEWWALFWVVGTVLSGGHCFEWWALSRLMETI